MSPSISRFATLLAIVLFGSALVVSSASGFAPASSSVSSYTLSNQGAFTNN